MTDPVSEKDPLRNADVDAASSSVTIDARGHESSLTDTVAERTTLTCTQCQAVMAMNATFCADCGLIVNAESGTRDEPVIPTTLIGGRYRMSAVASQRGTVTRFRGLDMGTSEPGLPVMLLREPLAGSSNQLTNLEQVAEDRLDFHLPDEGEQRTDELFATMADSGTWPSVMWEQRIHQAVNHLAMPRVLDTIDEDGFRYLIAEIPTGRSLWDGWDDTQTTWNERFNWLLQIAELVVGFHHVGTIVEELRPEMFVISTTGHIYLTDLSVLLPLPMAEDVQLRGSFYSAPELLLRPALTDERADVYTFGAFIYALMMGRELTELDFSLAGKPRSFLERFPDAHPYLARLIMKTFVREIHMRFPTEDGSHTDPTGFAELIECLQACRRTIDRVHLEVSAWSNTGMVRSGNEDAVVVLHSTEGRLNDTDEFALVLLADGMGGMESGEIAAAMTLQVLRQRLINMPPFIAFQTRQLAPSVVGDTPSTANELKTTKTTMISPAKYPAEGLMVRPEDRDTAARNDDSYRERLAEALREANRQVYDAARYGFGGRGMGCTAEAIIIDGQRVVIGHVGDSRVYHMRRNKLTLVTRDQTYVQRMVDLGQLTLAEAEMHPRRSELEQAVGGRGEIYPDLLTLTLVAGDWLLVCSDGLSNQLHENLIEHVLHTSPNAEKASRRLINLALEAGAYDNVTVAVIHAT